MNPLEQWFEAHNIGPGIWKWRHYLGEVYHRHLSRFRGQPVRICEVGVYSGGSLVMWRDYFGQGCQVYGVDIQPACRRYETDWCHVFIGDQADRLFWQYFKSQVPRLDILVDDGGHAPQQQITTMEEMLPHLSPGGVYICEDVLNDRNREFAERAAALSVNLHENVDIKATDMLAMGLTETQCMVHSVHAYAHVVVIEKWLEAPARFEAPAHGSEWIHTSAEWKP